MRIISANSRVTVRTVRICRCKHTISSRSIYCSIVIGYINTIAIVRIGNAYSAVVALSIIINEMISAYHSFSRWIISIISVAGSKADYEKDKKVSHRVIFI